MFIRIILSVLMLVMSTGTSSAKDAQSLRATIAEFSSAMREDGGGWKAYETYLHEDFSRWSSWQPVYTFEEFMPGMRQWWEEGNRQASREAQELDLRVHGDIEIARYRLQETYVDPEGNDNGTFNGLVDHVWKYENNQWKLLALNIFRVEEDAQ